MKSEKRFRVWLLFWELFIGTGAVVGAAMMFIEPAGGDIFRMKPLLEMMQAMPFSHLFFRSLILPGIALLVFNGVTNFIACYMLVRRYRYAPAAGIVCGVVLMLWICVQFVIFPFNVISTLYFIFGVAEASTAWLLLREVNKRR